MKRKSFLGLLFVFTFLTGCASSPAENTPPSVPGPSTDKTPGRTLEEYYPFLENVRYEYVGEGNEFASFIATVDFLEGDKIQLRQNNGGTETIRVLSRKDGKLTELFSREETYFRENFLNETEEENVLLMEPLAAGTEWKGENGDRFYISKTGVPVETPAGTFDALEVTRESGDTKILYYYAKDTGLVKQEFVSGDMKITSMLSKLVKDVPLTQTVRFFYPSVDEDRLYFAEKELSFPTNEKTETVFEAAFKEVPDAAGLNRILGPNVKINEMTLLPDNVARIDFSKELISEMNAGSGYEGMILQSITNTVGLYFGVDEVVITVEQKPYASGHFEMREGEPFTVDLSKSVPLTQ